MVNISNIVTSDIRNGYTIWHSLTTKIILLTTAFILFSSLSLIYIYKTSSGKILYAQFSKIKLLEEKIQSAELLDSVNSARRDLSIIKNDPVLASVLSRLEKPSESATLWKQRLEQQFSAYMQQSPDYMQLRLISVRNGGKELVRVDRAEDRLIPIANTGLQDKSHRDYYQDTIRLGVGEFYISEINLNREHGEIEIPRVPTIRISTPIFNQHSQLLAILIVNIDLRSTFNKVRQLTGSADSTLYLINERGDYLVHPDKSKEFAFDYGRQERLQYDMPQLWTQIKGMDQKGLSSQIELDGEKQLVRAINLTDRINIGKKVIAIQLTPESLLYEDINDANNLGQLTAIGITIFSIFAALVFSRRTLLPINFLTSAVVKATSGNYARFQFSDRKDEIGILSRSFKHMMGRIDQRETQILESEARYKAIFCSARDGIVILDEYANIEEANPAFTAITGIEQDQLKGIKLQSLIRTSDSIDMSQIKIESISDTPLYLGEVKILTNYDEAIPATVSISTFQCESGCRYVAYVHNLKQVKQSEEERLQLLLQLKQAQKMESVGQLTSGIAHDFKNFLTCILGYAQLLETNTITDEKERQSCTKNITSAAQNAHEMIEHMLNFSRNSHTTEGETEVESASEEIFSVLDHALTSQITLTADLDAKNIVIPLPKFQLQQIILNLCINARDAMGGRGTIHIKAYTKNVAGLICATCKNEFNGEFAVIEVADNGNGMEDEVMKNIFTPFYTTKPVGKGTGLGLAMVSNIMHEAGGHIIVNTSSAGTCFRLLLPYVEMKASE